MLLIQKSNIYHGKQRRQFFYLFYILNESRCMMVMTSLYPIAFL